MYDDTDKKKNEMGPKSGKKYEMGRGLPPIRAKQNNKKKTSGSYQRDEGTHDLTSE